MKDNPAAQVRSDQPIRTRQPNVIEQQEYAKVYKSINKDKDRLENQLNVVVEGEMTFKSLLIIPSSQFTEQAYENIKQHIRRVLTTDDFKDMMPSYLSLNSCAAEEHGLGDNHCGHWCTVLHHQQHKGLLRQ